MDDFETRSFPSDMRTSFISFPGHRNGFVAVVKRRRPMGCDERRGSFSGFSDHTVRLKKLPKTVSAVSIRPVHCCCPVKLKRILPTIQTNNPLNPRHPIVSITPVIMQSLSFPPSHQHLPSVPPPLTLPAIPARAAALLSRSAPP